MSEHDLLAQLAIADRIVSFICARSRLSADEAADFNSHVKLKLLDDDHAILRKFGGLSSIESYLGIIIKRLLLDYRRAAWGNWRPSAEAKRHGETGVLLDRLLTRDGYSVDQAYEVLTTNYRVALTRDAVERLAERLPARRQARTEGEDSLSLIATSGPSPDQALEAQTRARNRSRITDLLEVARTDLLPRDQLLLTLRFEDGRTVAEISRVLAEDDKVLYRRIDRLLRDLRAKLERQGVAAADIAEVFDAPFFFSDAGEEFAACPSIGTGAEK